MSEYRLSIEADIDLDELYTYGYYKYGEHQADKFFVRLIGSFELLADFPLSGKAANSIYPGLRRVEFNPYVILYQPRDYGVYVVRVLRQTMIVKPDHIEPAL